MKIKELTEEISQQQLDQVERFADKLFAKAGIDIQFTRHFVERMNDERNGKPISAAELIHLFKRTWVKFGRAMAEFPDNFEAVIHDISTDVNIPFVINANPDDKKLITKTVMRKKDFKTDGEKLVV
jgi:hypothetical protein